MATAAFSFVLLVGSPLGWFTTKETPSAWDQLSPGSFSSVWGDGDYFYACGTTLTGGSHAFIAKGDSLGNLLWNRTWNTITNETGLQVWGNNQSIFICGQTFPSGLYYVSAWDREGNYQWNQTFGYSSDLYGLSGVWCDQDAVYASWVEYQSGAGYRLFLSKWDSTGVPLWTVYRNATESSYESGMRGRRIWGNGDAIYVGYVSEHDEPAGHGSYWILQDFLLVKWRKNGNLSWAYTKDVGHADDTTAIWGDETGIYLCGNDGLNNAWITLMKWNEDGHVLWLQVWEDGRGGQATNLWSQGNDLYLGARSNGKGLLLKYTVSGTLQWVQSSENSSTDAITGFAGVLITCGGALGHAILQRYDISQYLFGVSPFTFLIIPACLSSSLLVVLVISARRRGVLRSSLENMGKYAITLSFVLANSGLFLYLFAFGGDTSIFALSLQKSAINSGEWWRFFTSLWMHWDPVHLVENMIGLAFFGYLLEWVERLRKWHYVTIYLGAGLAGNVATYLDPTFAPNVYSLGASGCIFGILAATLFLRGVKDKKGVIAGVIYILYTFVTGMLSMGVNVVAHVAGILSGLVLVALLTKDAGDAGDHYRKLKRRRKFLYGR